MLMSVPTEILGMQRAVVVFRSKKKMPCLVWQYGARSLQRKGSTDQARIMVNGVCLVARLGHGRRKMPGCAGHTGCRQRVEASYYSDAPVEFVQGACTPSRHNSQGGGVEHSLARAALGGKTGTTAGPHEEPASAFSTGQNPAWE